MKRETELERFYMYNFLLSLESYSAEVELLLIGQYSELISHQRLLLKRFCLAT